MRLIIASQLEDGFNDGLRAHAAAPIVIRVPEDKPWEAANDADVLLVRPSCPDRTHSRPPGGSVQGSGRDQAAVEDP